MKRQGFSLVELLVVLALLGVLAIIGTIQVLGFLQKNELQSEAQQIKAFLQEVPQLVAKHQQVLWVVFRPTGGTGPGGVLQISRNPAGTEVLRQYQIRNSIAFGLQSPVEWVNWAPGATSGTFTLGCDTFNRAVRPGLAGLEQIQSPALGVLTHQKMRTGALRPRYRWVIAVEPVWNVGLVRGTPTP